MPEISRPGATIRYQFSQGRDRTPIVFLNSLGTDLSMWDGVAAHLGDRYSLLRLDTRGHGGSSCDTDKASISLLAEDVLAVMDAAGIGKALLVGLSLGGLTAQKIAIDHPDRVAGLVLCATASAFRPREMWEERAARSLAEGSATFEEPSAQRWFTEGFRESDPEITRRLVSMVGATSDTGYAACCRVLADTDLTDDLPRITAPTLLIAGAQDLATPPSGHEAIAERIGGSRLECLDPAAHMLAVEQPEATARLIGDFAATL